jgi:ABC-2 type transport system ATP-binding protein
VAGAFLVWMSLVEDTVMAAAIYAREVTKKYGLPLPFSLGRRPRPVSSPGSAVAVALDRITFSVEEGEIFGVAGQDGSGKSTLVRILAALLPPDDGEVRIFGYDVRRHSQQAQRQSNRVSVEASFFRRLSPLDNLLQGIGHFSAGREQARREAIETLLSLGLDEDTLNRPIEMASRREQQKIVIARALLARPRLLLLDEPFTGLDGCEVWLVSQALLNLRQVCGATILFTTRQPAEAAGLCDRLAWLEQGQLVSIEVPLQLAGSLPGAAGEALGCTSLAAQNVYLEPHR